MSKLLQWGFGEISKFNGILFYPKVLLSIQFLPVLTGLGGDCPDQFLLHILPSCPLHLCIHIPISLPHNISPHRSLFYILLPIPHNLCPPHTPLFIALPILFPHHICPPREPLSPPFSCFTSSSSSL